MNAPQPSFVTIVRSLIATAQTGLDKCITLVGTSWAAILDRTRDQEYQRPRRKALRGLQVEVGSRYPSAWPSATDDSPTPAVPVARLNRVPSVIVSGSPQKKQSQIHAPTPRRHQSIAQHPLVEPASSTTGTTSSHQRVPSRGQKRAVSEDDEDDSQQPPARRPLPGVALRHEGASTSLARPSSRTRTVSALQVPHQRDAGADSGTGLSSAPVSRSASRTTSPNALLLPQEREVRGRTVSSSAAATPPTSRIPIRTTQRTLSAGNLPRLSTGYTRSDSGPLLSAPATPTLDSRPSTPGSDSRAGTPIQLPLNEGGPLGNPTDSALLYKALQLLSDHVQAVDAGGQEQSIAALQIELQERKEREDKLSEDNATLRAAIEKVAPIPAQLAAVTESVRAVEAIVVEQTAEVLRVQIAAFKAREAGIIQDNEMLKTEKAKLAKTIEELVAEQVKMKEAQERILLSDRLNKELIEQLQHAQRPAHRPDTDDARTPRGTPSALPDEGPSRMDHAASAALPLQLTASKSTSTMSICTDTTSAMSVDTVESGHQAGGNASHAPIHAPQPPQAVPARFQHRSASPAMSDQTLASPLPRAPPTPSTPAARLHDAPDLLPLPYLQQHRSSSPRISEVSLEPGSPAPPAPPSPYLPAAHPAGMPGDAPNVGGAGFYLQQQTDGSAGPSALQHPTHPIQPGASQTRNPYVSEIVMSPSWDMEAYRASDPDDSMIPPSESVDMDAYRANSASNPGPSA